MKPLLTLIAGVEIANGEVGGLVNGEVTAERLRDPVAAAHRWIAEGAEWLHVADLDAAAGTGNNDAVRKDVLKAVAHLARIQLAGGIRDADSLDAALALRPQRIVLDTEALVDMPWVSSVLAAYGDQVAVDLAVHKLALHAPGTNIHGTPMTDMLIDLESAGATSFVVTDVDATGSRKGSKREALKVVCELERHHVIAGGGVAHLNDLHHLVELIPQGLQAVVLDHALYDGAFSFPEAIATAEPRYDYYVWGPPQP